MFIDVPTLRTPRLLLRPWTLADAPDVQRICNDPLVVRGLMRMAYPLSLEEAEKYLAARINNKLDGCDRAFAFAVTADGAIVGYCSLRTQDAHTRAEMGYWMGREFWGRGYITEACGEVLRFGFQDLKLRRVSADYFRSNTASGRVLEKLGFTIEGCQRRHIVRPDRIEDLVLAGLLREEWERSPANS